MTNFSLGTRALFWPFRRFQLARRNKRKRAEQRLIQKFANVLAEDPVVRVNGFGRGFSLPITSELFSRVLRTNGEYEPEHLSAIRKHINQDLDAIDIGANVGFFTVLFAHLLHKERRVLALEPSPAAFERIERNLHFNGIDKEKVITVKAAASNEEGKAILNCPPGREEYSSFGPIVAAPDLVADTITVQTVCVDRMVQECGLEPGIIKIDAEGAEPLILNGSKNTIQRFRPVIFIEDAPRILEANGFEPNAVANILERLNYEPIMLEGRGTRRNLWLPRC